MEIKKLLSRLGWKLYAYSWNGNGSLFGVGAHKDKKITTFRTEPGLQRMGNRICTKPDLIPCDWLRRAARPLSRGTVCLGTCGHWAVCLDKEKMPDNLSFSPTYDATSPRPNLKDPESFPLRVGTNDTQPLVPASKLHLVSFSLLHPCGSTLDASVFSHGWF